MSHSSHIITSDIEEYLQLHENKDMLRFLTCGSVDDGKSTLIGRLLYDSKMIFEDQLAAVKKASKHIRKHSNPTQNRKIKENNTSDEQLDLALLVDGLQSEREQGITIDVAYRYFSTAQRKFIIADTPGHEQYTRNMVTGASNCDLAIILIDARHGVQVQTRRHSYLCSLLGIRHIIVAVNKMDLVGYDRERYKKIKQQYRAFAKELNFNDIRFVPISALKGDNVVHESRNMTWYPGSPLMKLLNSVDIQHNKFQPFRFPVQYVNRPDSDFRGFAGTIMAGDIRVGDRVVALPSGKKSHIESIVTFDGKLESASVDMPVTITLQDEIDISRGDMLVRPHEKPQSSALIEADVVWMAEDAMHMDRQYEIKLGVKSVLGEVQAINYKVNINTLEHESAQRLELNEIGRCQFSFTETIQFDAYDENRHTGCFIIIDRLTNATAGAGMIRHSLSGGLIAARAPEQYSEFERELNKLVCKHFPHWGAKKLS